MILSFEVVRIYNSDGKDAIQTYVDLLRAARQQLSFRVNDTLAHRGVVLLDSIFKEAGCVDPISETAELLDLTPITIEDIVSRFTFDLGMVGLDTQLDAEAWGSSWSDIDKDHSGTYLEEFNDWFERTFHA